jgi:hypothetical protein
MREANNKVPEKISTMERADMLLPYRGGVKANLYLPVPPK